jgi:hypothetical protein
VKTDSNGLVYCPRAGTVVDENIGSGYNKLLGFFYDGNLTKDFPPQGLVAPRKGTADFDVVLANRAVGDTILDVGFIAILFPCALGKGNGTVDVRLQDYLGGTPYDIQVNLTQVAIPVCVQGFGTCDFSKAFPERPNPNEPPFNT